MHACACACVHMHAQAQCAQLCNCSTFGPRLAAPHCISPQRLGAMVAKTLRGNAILGYMTMLRCLHATSDQEAHLWACVPGAGAQALLAQKALWTRERLCSCGFAMFLMMFLAGMRWLMDVMALVLAAIGLQVSIDKIAVIPMWTTDVEQARSDIARRAPAAVGVSVVRAFRHLGVAVGPDAEATRWSTTLARFMVRAAAIRAAQPSVAEALQLYNGLAFSVLPFLASFIAPPAEAYVAEAQGLARVLGAPLWAMPVDLLASLLALRLPAIVPHLRAVSLSARLLHVQRLRHWGTVQRLLDERIDNDGSLLGRDIWPDWRRRSLEVQLRAVWRAAWGVGLRLLLHDSALSRRRLAHALVPELRRRDPLEILAARLQVLLGDEAPHRELLDFYLRT